MAEEAKNTAPVNPLSREYQQIEQQYRRDVTLVGARPLLSNLAFLLWLLVDAAMIGFFAYVVVGYVVSDSFTDKRSEAALANNVSSIHATTLATTPQNLLLSSARKISNNATTEDVGADVENPNKDWYATFTYSFSSAGTPIDGFINPLEKRTLLGLALPLAASPEFSLSNLTWHRVDRHSVPDTASWLALRNSFAVSGIVYSNDIDPTAAQLGRTDFTLTNSSAYSYWSPKFIVMLQTGTNPVAVTEITVPRFLAGEARQINVRWVDKIPTSATMVVVPEINYFDSSIYMEPQQ